MEREEDDRKKCPERMKNFSVKVNFESSSFKLLWMRCSKQFNTGHSSIIEITKYDAFPIFLFCWGCRYLSLKPQVTFLSGYFTAKAKTILNLFSGKLQSSKILPRHYTYMVEVVLNANMNMGAIKSFVVV